MAINPIHQAHPINQVDPENQVNPVNPENQINDIEINDVWEHYRNMTLEQIVEEVRNGVGLEEKVKLVQEKFKEVLYIPNHRVILRNLEDIPDVVPNTPDIHFSRIIPNSKLFIKNAIDIEKADEDVKNWIERKEMDLKNLIKRNESKLKKFNKRWEGFFIREVTTITVGSGISLLMIGGSTYLENRIAKNLLRIGAIGTLGVAYKVLKKFEVPTSKQHKEEWNKVVKKIISGRDIFVGGRILDINKELIVLNLSPEEHKEKIAQFNLIRDFFVNLQKTRICLHKPEERNQNV